MEFESLNDRNSSSEIKVVVDNRVLGGYRRRALRHFPNEYMETLWGRISNNVITIIAFQAIEHEATTKDLSYDDDQIFIQTEDANDEKLQLLGTIHSHPYPTHTCTKCGTTADPSPSKADWVDMADNSEIVSGVCAIWVRESGRKQTKIQFWPNQAICKLIVR